MTVAVNREDARTVSGGSSPALLHASRRMLGLWRQVRSVISYPAVDDERGAWMTSGTGPGHRRPCPNRRPSPSESDGSSRLPDAGRQRERGTQDQGGQDLDAHARTIARIRHESSWFRPR